MRSLTTFVGERAQVAERAQIATITAQRLRPVLGGLRDNSRQQNGRPERIFFGDRVMIGAVASVER